MVKTGKGNRIDRYEGAMLRVEIGDALGAPLEFMSAGRIEAKHGTVREMIGGGWLVLDRRIGKPAEPNRAMKIHWRSV